MTFSGVVLAEGGASAGPLGLLIVVLLGIVTVFLVRNMTGRLKKLPTTFEDRDRHGRPVGPPGALTPDGVTPPGGVSPPRDGLDPADPASGPSAGA